jgi:diguanylate cyclase (GGDEF)-like protein
VSRLRSVAGRPQWYAYYLAAPLALLTVALIIPLATRYEVPVRQLPAALLYLALILVSQAIVLRFELRQQSVSVTIGEIPLLLALFYLSPPWVILLRAVACLVVQVIQRNPPVKVFFNVVGVSLATTVAGWVASSYPFVPGDVTPMTWLVLAAATFASSATSLVAVLGVICIVQGIPPLRSLARASTSVLAVTAVNIMIGLVILQVVQGQKWAVPLLLGLVGLLALVYRSYAQFHLQHRSLTELYELTQAMTAAGRDRKDNALPDVLLGRVRELLQAEYATLWIPAKGRHPEVLLSARVDAQGLLDQTPTPPVLRERAMSEGVTIAVGPKLGDSGMRALLRGSGVNDAIVVPLRSGSVVIGCLEVSGKLAPRSSFRPADIRLLETLAAHTAVAVENDRLVERLRFDAYHDVLTGLPNRRRVVAMLEEALKVRAPGEVVAVLAFDIGDLRDVNDSLGHDAGDRMVREVGIRLRTSAPAAAFVGRSGSDEFLVTLRLPDPDAALALGRELRTAVQQPLQLGEIALDVHVAVGIAVHPDHATDPETLIRHADLAAQTAKQFTTPVHLFHPNLRSRSSHRRGLAGDMRRALENGGVEVYFQPKLSLPGRQVVGVECLARWQHQVRGDEPPEDFVAVAEHTGQLGRLTDVVLREGLRRARGWLDSGRELPVSVNLSSRTLVDPTCPGHVADLLAEAGVPASLLTLEISEDGVVGDSERTTVNLRRLADMGVRLAVDDFGIGSTSLSSLRRLPFHEVKIDRSFVQGMATDADDLAIVTAVVGLARHFGLVAVAEGVENERTVNLLEDLGCGVGQGFLFSRPLPYERLEAWLAGQREAATAGLAVPNPGSPGDLQHPETDEPPPDGRRLRAV